MLKFWTFLGGVRPRAYGMELAGPRMSATGPLLPSGPHPTPASLHRWLVEVCCPVLTSSWHSSFQAIVYQEQIILSLVCGCISTQHSAEESIGSGSDCLCLIVLWHDRIWLVCWSVFVCNLSLQSSAFWVRSDSSHIFWSFFTLLYLNPY